MNLNDGNGETPTSTSLKENKEIMACIVCQKKKGVPHTTCWNKKRCVQKERKEDVSYCLLKEEMCAQKESKGK
jgi:hypothetical protein